jgi:type I restriction enzyme, S subunit
MKDSGVEWLGEVPEHWSIKAIKWVSPVMRGASPRPIDDPKYFDDQGEYAWVRIADVSASDGSLVETTQCLSELGSSLSVKLEPESLFVSIAGTVGKPCVTKIRACIHDGFVYFPQLNIDHRFLYRIFEAGLCYLGLGKLGTQLNLNTDTIGSIQIALPPLDELNSILSHLDSVTGSLDELIAEAGHAIEILQERRSALISAAVTGKIDVRGLVSQEAA